jgi:hypothetical protein
MVLKSGSDYAPNLASLVRCIDDTKPQGCHKTWSPENKLVDLTRKEANVDVGNSALAGLRGLFA